MVTFKTSSLNIFDKFNKYQESRRRQEKIFIGSLTLTLCPYHWLQRFNFCKNQREKFIAPSLEVNAVNQLSFRLSQSLNYNFLALAMKLQGKCVVQVCVLTPLSKPRLVRFNSIKIDTLCLIISQTNGEKKYSGIFLSILKIKAEFLIFYIHSSSYPHKV